MLFCSLKQVLDVGIEYFQSSNTFLDIFFVIVVNSLLILIDNGINCIPYFWERLFWEDHGLSASTLKNTK